ncbi:MAG: molybdopterin biosynthesis protein [Candidatus Dadabacteria bacterium]|nr:MAG: molybdopterin biosynthesis protein [Candidatus Dadabacteria bacterium]
MSEKGFLHRVSLERARAILLELACRTEAQTIPSEEAAGRVTAEPVRARLAAPHYRASGMDGLAVRAADTRTARPDNPLRLEVGTPDRDRPACQPVDTGSPLPPWADAVVRIEDARPVGAGYEITAPVAIGQDVRAVGEDVPAGVVLFGRGHRIRPVDIGVMLATGVYSVAVARKPRIVTLATGDEIVEPGTEPRPGEVIEFNSRVVAAYAEQWGAEAVYAGSVCDRRDDLAAAVRKGATEGDVLCVIAGSSAGRKDLTAAVLAECGRLLVHGIDIRPGKPTAIAQVEGRPVIGLPGYPVSAAIVCRELLRPLVMRLLGTACDPPETVSAEVPRPISSKLGVEEFVRVCLTWDGQGFAVAPLPRGAGSISTLARADGIVRIGPTCEGIEGGRTVEVELLRPIASVRRTVVVATHPTPVTAVLEDVARRSGRFLRLAHLGLSDHDAVAAIAAGQVHAAVFEGSGGETRAKLRERARDAKLFEIRAGTKLWSLILTGSLERAGALEALVELMTAKEFACALAEETGTEEDAVEIAGPAAP